MDPAELEALIRLYLAARDQLLNTIIYYQGVGTKVYANTILKQLEKQLKTLEAATNRYISEVIPMEYQKALDEVYDYFKKNNLMMKSPAVFAQIHNDAIYAVAREMQYQIGQGFEQAGRQVLRYIDAAQDNALRTAGLTATGEKMASGSTVPAMKQNLIGKLQDQGFMSVQYGSGEKAYQVSLDSYAGMVARSTTREAGNLARMNQLTANGYDLVKLSEHYPTCDVCAKFQGRVYSISGEDKRFPPLERAFRFGYKNIHPNCRHVAAPWIEALQSPEELQEALDKSNMPFEDSRPEVEKALYNKQQGNIRQLRQDRYQYERYKARIGEDAPKSFRVFRQIKKAGGDAWSALEKKYRTDLFIKPFDEIKHLQGSLSDFQVRKWYDTHDKMIPSMLDKTAPIEDQSRQAHAIRNQYRTQARDLMFDQDERKRLDIEHPNRTYEQMIEHKMRDKGLTYSQAVLDIIETAAKTNPVVNKKLGLED